MSDLFWKLLVQHRVFPIIAVFLALFTALFYHSRLPPAGSFTRSLGAALTTVAILGGLLLLFAYSFMALLAGGGRAGIEMWPALVIMVTAAILAISGLILGSR